MRQVAGYLRKASILRARQNVCNTGNKVGQQGPGINLSMGCKLRFITVRILRSHNISLARCQRCQHSYTVAPLLTNRTERTGRKTIYMRAADVCWYAYSMHFAVLSANRQRRKRRIRQVLPCDCVTRGDRHVK